MKCPHCSTDLKYRERGGQKCSSCGREFALEPKNDPLGLHDIKFRNAVSKLSADGKFYFTSGQLFYFLSRKKIKNTFHTARGFLIFFVIVCTVGSIPLSSTPLVFLTVPAAVVFAILLIIFWKQEGRLTLPKTQREFEDDALHRWRTVYQKLPPRLITNAHLPPENSRVLENTRGILICHEQEILACLAANGTAENLGLILLNAPPTYPQTKNAKLDFIRERRDLPIFILHDASIEGCLMKDEFIRRNLGGEPTRRVYDIGLRPRAVMKSNLLRLRENDSTNLTDGLSGLAPEEIAWLKKGYYTPLLALAPAQLINLVSGAVQRVYQRETKAAAQTNAEAVGFMTWLDA